MSSTSNIRYPWTVAWNYPSSTFTAQSVVNNQSAEQLDKLACDGITGMRDHLKDGKPSGTFVFTHHTTADFCRNLADRLNTRFAQVTDWTRPLWNEFHIDFIYWHAEYKDRV